MRLNVMMAKIKKLALYYKNTARKNDKASHDVRIDVDHIITATLR